MIVSVSMIRLIAILLCCAAATCCGASYDQAVRQALRTLGEPIGYSPKLKSDAIASNALPARVSVHKVIPRKFSENTMQQVFKLTGIDTNSTFKGATEGVFGTPGVRYYGSLEQNHTLAVIPAQGWMHYERLEAMDDKGNKTLTGPSEEETLRRALEFANVFGLNESDFARHPLKNRLDYLFTKIEGGPVRLEPRVKVRGVMLRRAIDGFPVTNGRLYGGFAVEYGFHGMIYKFELIARATEPLSAIHVAPVSEQLKVLATGKDVFCARWPASSDELRKDKAAELTLTLIELVYFEDAPEKFQKIIPPLLRWEGTLTHKGQEHTVILYTPVKEAKRD